MILPAILLVLTACRDPDPPPVPAASECESGFILDGSNCVPESCGTGRWGNLPVDDDTVYVDVTAEEGGDGTEEAPYPTIQRGLNRAGALGGGLVAVAAGTYPETLEFTTDHADVHLVGRCREMVILDASVGDEETPGIGIDAGYGAVEVSGVTVSESLDAGLVVASGEVAVRDSAIMEGAYFGVVAYLSGFSGIANLVMEGCLIDGNTEVGIVSSKFGTQVTLRDTTVRDTLPGANGEFGWGIAVEDGATLSAEGCLIDGNTEHGLFAYNPGTQVTLLETTVKDTLPNASGEGGRGIEANDGVTLVAEDCVIEGSTELGIAASDLGTQIVLNDTAVRRTQSNANGEYGIGIGLASGATLMADGCLVEENGGAGILFGNPGTRVTLVNTVVRNTQLTPKGVYGQGIEVEDGGILSATGCLIDRNHSTGLIMGDPGTQVTLVDTTVRDTLPIAGGAYARV